MRKDDEVVMYWRCLVCRVEGSMPVAPGIKDMLLGIEEIEVEHALATGCNGRVVEVPHRVPRRARPPLRAYATCQQCGKHLESGDCSYLPEPDQTVIFRFICGCRLTGGRFALAAVPLIRLETSPQRAVQFDYVFSYKPAVLMSHVGASRVWPRLWNRRLGEMTIVSKPANQASRDNWPFEDKFEKALAAEKAAMRWLDRPHWICSNCGFSIEDGPEVRVETCVNCGAPKE